MAPALFTACRDPLGADFHVRRFTGEAGSFHQDNRKYCLLGYLQRWPWPLSQSSSSRSFDLESKLNGYGATMMPRF